MQAGETGAAAGPGAVPPGRGGAAPQGEDPVSPPPRERVRPRHPGRGVRSGTISARPLTPAAPRL